MRYGQGRVLSEYNETLQRNALILKHQNIKRGHEFGNLKKGILLISAFNEALLYRNYSLEIKKVNLLFNKDGRNLIFFRKSSETTPGTVSLKDCSTGSKKQNNDS